MKWSSGISGVLQDSERVKEPGGKFYDYKNSASCVIAISPGTGHSRLSRGETGSRGAGIYYYDISCGPLLGPGMFFSRFFPLKFFLTEVF